MSLNPGGILSLRTVLLCAAAFGGYQSNRFINTDPSGTAVNEQSAGMDQASLPRLVGYTADQPADKSPSIVGSLVTFPFAKSSAGGPASASGQTNLSEDGIGTGATNGNLRIASWAINGFGPKQLRDPELAAIFVDCIRRFDVIALQQVNASERDFLANLVAMLNRDGRAYDYLAGPVQGGNAGFADAAAMTDGEQLVFLYDTASVVTDRSQLYSVADPENRLRHKPLVAWFRAAKVDPRRAWTFSMVNVRVDVSRARQEVAELSRLHSVIGADGRGEDDIVVAGLLQADRSYLQGTLARPDYWFAAEEKRTDIYAKYQTSNVVVDRRTTTEAVQRGGVLDFLRLHNLSITQAERITPHLPVYAEFSPWEGGYR